MVQSHASHFLGVLCVLVLLVLVLLLVSNKEALDLQGVSGLQST